MARSSKTSGPRPAPAQMAGYAEEAAAVCAVLEEMAGISRTQS